MTRGLTATRMLGHLIPLLTKQEGSLPTGHAHTRAGSFPSFHVFPLRPCFIEQFLLKARMASAEVLKRERRSQAR